MRKIYAVLFGMLLFASVTKAQVTTIWSDDFETDKGWILSGEFERGAPDGGGGDHGNDNPTSAYSGSYVLGTNLDGGYADDLNEREYAAVSPVIDCSGKQNVMLNFQRWLNVESSDYDFAYIDVYDGSSWQNIWTNETSTLTESSWSAQSIDISAYADGNSGLQIRFALGSTDYGWNYSGWNIDDIEIAGEIATSFSNVFTSSGTFTVPNGVTSITVECWGAGGAGGGSTSNKKGGSGGGGGGYTTSDLVVTPGEVISYTVGVGGVASTGNGGDGGSTSFKSLIADGGTGGGRNKGTAGIGGVGSGGTTNVNGDSGTQGGNTGGAGGAGANGGDGGVGNVKNTNGNDGSSPGGGGSGGEATNRNSFAGGNGADGQINISYDLPLEVVKTTYYSYRSGNWSDISTWTHDPGGTTQTATDIPGDDARVVILNGRTVTMDVDISNSNLNLAIRDGGFLDMSSHVFTNTLTELSGKGTLKLASVHFPDATINYLVEADGGIVEYDNSSDFDLPVAQTSYNHLVINGAAIATQKHDLNIYGDLHIKQGTYRINDGSANRYALTIDGNVTVDSGAALTVGTGKTTSNDTDGGTAPFTDYYANNTHTIVVNGDFTNNGSVRLTNQNYPVYNAFPDDGAATVYFKGTTDNTLLCNGTTDFYNLVLDKGVDKTFKLTVYASAYDHFRLFGRNNLGKEGSGSNPNLRKALWVRTGTLELTGLTIIPSLTEGGEDFIVPANGAFLMNGTDVIVLSTANNYAEVNAAYGLSESSGNIHGVYVGGNQAFSIYGKLQVDKGYLSSRRSGGFITWSESSGEFIINGGHVDARQIRSSTADALSSFSQTGGLLTLRGRLSLEENPSTPAEISGAALSGSSYTSDISNSYGTFSMFLPASVFAMSGGEIEILDVSGSNGYAFDVASAAKNINVTGGTIRFKPQGSSNEVFKIRSTAPFYNMVIENEGSGSPSVQLVAYSSGGTDIEGDRIVLNDLSLGSGSFNANGYDVTVGGDFSLADGTSYTTGDNSTIFNGTEEQKLTVEWSSALSLHKWVVNKSASRLLLDGSQTIIDVADSLIIYDGELNDNSKTIQVAGNIYNAGVHSGDGLLLMSGSSITGNGSGQFQNLQLDRNGEISLDANIIVNGTLTFAKDYVLNIETNNISFAADASIVGSSSSRYIKTAGNAGDGGVTFSYSAITEKTFPLGVDAYTPATIGFTSAPSTYGDITVVPVNYEHPTTTSDDEALDYFWRISSTGFTGVNGKVSHEFHYDQSDVAANESAYLPARYDAASYAWNKGTTADVVETNTINDWVSPSVSADYIDGDYTAGLNSAFGTPQKYYSRQSGYWYQSSTWSTSSHTGGAASSIPGSGDIVIIGNGHTVSLLRWDTSADRSPQYCASLQIETGAVLDATYNPSSDFGMVISHPSGNGKIRVSVNDNSQSIFEFPNGDFSDFNANLGTTELYTNNATAGTTYWLPDGVEEYGNLMLSPLGGSNIIFPNQDVTILGDLTADGQSSESWYCPTWNSNYPNGFANRTRQAKTITIKGDFNLVGGALIYYGNNSLAQDFVIEGDLVVAEDAGITVYSNANNQSIAIGGDLINNARSSGGGANAYRGCDFEDIPLTFFGDTNAKITQSDGVSYTTYTNVESITVNKGSSQATSLTMDIAGTVSYESTEWLSLVNGTFIYNRDADVTVNTNNSFTIPGTAGLTIDSNNDFNLCQGNDDDYDVYLNGKLTLVYGSLNIGNSSNNRNNDIEYSGGGLSEIDVQGGNLYVNGQIRRNPASSAGILKYSQSGGDVTINGRNALASNAKLEILNVGSEFNMTDGTLTIMRGGGTSYGDLYLRPEKVNVTGGEIIFDNSGVGAQNYLLDANISLNDLTIDGSGDDASVKLMLSPLILDGDLTLANAYSILDANATYNVALTVNGDFENSGVYNYYENTTTLNGVTQYITGSSDIEFYDLVIDPLTKVALSKDITVYHDLNLNSGTLDVGAHSIYVKGDVINNATYSSTGNGLVLDGSVSQEISGTGTFARLELKNTSGATTANDISLQGELALTKGVLNIGSYSLSLGETASISGIFSENTMITTNGVYSNKGVQKVMSAGSSSFTFPVGVSGKYTPAVLNFTASSNVSTVKVHPVNSKHPANIDDANVLEYYWAVESVGLVGASGSLVLNYKDEDVQGDDANYYAERLLVPGTAWSESNSVDETANQITFTLSGDDISGEYTAGLDAAFPDNIPQYTSTMNGDWSDPTSWTQTGGDAYTLSGAPNGFIVYIQHDITLDENFVQANKVIIESDGTLKIDNTTYGHILNNVSGSGTIYLEDGQLPEGNFDEFLSCSNTSTLEFGGSGDYGIIADLFNNAANLVFSGTGSRILPNADLTVCKQLLIDGPVLDNSLYNRALYINGSFERVAGSFISGSGSSAIVSFIGSTEQNLGGFSGADNMLNNLEIDNSAGLRLNDDVEVAGTLILTNGVIHTSSENSLTLTNTVGMSVTPSAGTANSYVNGPLRKWMNQSDSFTFPIGSDGELGNKLTITAVRTGTKLWTAEYKRPNGTYEDYAFPLTAINAHEYWNLSTPGGGEAKIQLGWDSGSDITPVMTEHGLTDIRVVNYDASSWQEIASSASGADAAGIVITNSRVYVNEAGSDFTTATVNTNKPKVRFNPDEAVCDLSTGIKVEMTSTVPTAADYELSYTINNGATQTVTVSSFPYYLPTPTIGVYALTGFKYDNKVREGVVDVTEFEVFETPTAALAGDDQSHQGLSQTTLEANTPVVGYGQWSIVSGTGGSLVDPTDPMTVFNGTNGSSYLLRWTITNGDCQSVDEVAIAFPILPPHQWQGAISDDWFTAGNWTDGVVPDGVADITIANAGNEPVIRSGAIAYVDNLTIEADASLTLEPGARMTINGDLITNDQLTVKNTVDAPVSLIVNGTVSGESNYEWDGMTNSVWWHIAHPVSNITESEYENSYGVNNYAVEKYTTSGWTRIAGYRSDDGDYNFNDDQVLEGYNFYTTKDGSLKYAGVLNNEDYSRTYTKAQWWKVANPYPSYIDVEDAGFDMGNFRKTVYIRKSDNSVSAYNVLNGVGVNEGSRYISPGQSVWMRTHSATDYVNISTTTRVHETGGYGLKSGSEEGNDRVRLQLQSDYGTDETVVIFNENGSEFFTAYDSEKLFNSGNIANIYSNKDGKEIAINSLPELESGMVIPLSYKVEEDGLSDFTIRATNLNSFIPEVDVYLEDKVEGLSVNLRETPEYTFMPLTTSASDRFELRFVESVSTGIESAEAEILQSNVTIYAVNQKAYVKVSEELLMANDRVIEVYNLSGQLKAQHELNSTKTVFDLPDSKTMYIIKVSIDQSSYQEKVIAF